MDFAQTGSLVKDRHLLQRQMSATGTCTCIQHSSLFERAGHSLLCPDKWGFLNIKWLVVETEFCDFKSIPCEVTFSLKK